MRRVRRLYGLRCVVGTAFLLTSASTALASTPLSLSSTRIQQSCGYEAYAVGPDNCSVTPSASASSGVAIADVRLVSPAGGLVPWKAEALGAGDVVAKHHLSSPVRELRFTVAIRVNHASVTVSNLPSWIENLQGVGYAYSNYAHLLLNAAGVSVGGAAWSPTCGQDCNAGTNEGVLTSYTPGTVNVSNEEHLFQVVMRRAGGQDIPAGDVYVSAGTVAWAGQSNGPGDDSARVEAMVKGISVD